MNKYVYILHIYEELFSKTRSPNLTLALQTRFMDLCLSRSGKELFKFKQISHDWLDTVALHYPTYQLRCPSLVATGRGEWIRKMQASSAGDQEFDSLSSQANDLWNWCLPSVALDINRIGQGLVISVSVECGCVGRCWWSSTIKSVWVQTAMSYFSCHFTHLLTSIWSIVR